MPGILTRLSRHVILVKLQERLHSLFGRYLLVTNTVITISLSGAGDLMQQYYEYLKKHSVGWDQQRSRNVCLSGLFIGPVCHFWYLYLDRILPGRTIKIVLKKVLADQLIISPICVASFLLVIGYSEGANRLQMLEDFRVKGPALLKAEWLVWPPAQVINFLLLPTKYRVLYDNTVSLGFDNYYSYVKYRRDKEKMHDLEFPEIRPADSSAKNYSRYFIPEVKFASKPKTASDRLSHCLPLGRNICGSYYSYPQWD